MGWTDKQYRVFWIAMALGVLIALYWIVRFAVADGIRDSGLMR